jgi:hypothetical protein
MSSTQLGMVTIWVAELYDYFIFKFQLIIWNKYESVSIFLPCTDKKK